MTEIRYPIRAVARLTGLTPDTLRAWERRYKAVVPERGPRGRLYTQKHIERLRLLRAAVEKGHAIGQAARLGNPELMKLAKLRPLSPPGEMSARGRTAGPQKVLRPVLTAIERYDCAGTDMELARLASVLAPRQLVHEVVIPLMQLVGDRFYSGTLNVAQEHMTSAILRNLLGALVHLYTPRDASTKLLFATPPGELHEFGILAAAMLAAGSGLGVIYLGPNLPEAEVVSAVRHTSPQAIVLGITRADDAVRSAVQQVARKTKGTKELWLGGRHAAKVGATLRGRSVLVLESLQEFESQLIRLGGMS